MQLNDEIQALVRDVKARDPNIQESSVKIELIERRMEMVKKQADTINDLEASKARKQERSYEETVDQLQHDLGTLEQDNMKLEALANSPGLRGLDPVPLGLRFALVVTRRDVCSVSRSAHRNGDIAGGRKG